MIKVAKTIVGCLLVHTYVVEIRIKVEGVVCVPRVKVSDITIRSRIDVSGVTNYGG